MFRNNKTKYEASYTNGAFEEEDITRSRRPGTDSSSADNPFWGNGMVLASISDSILSSATAFGTGMEGQTMIPMLWASRRCVRLGMEIKENIESLSGCEGGNRCGLSYRFVRVNDVSAGREMTLWPAGTGCVLLHIIWRLFRL